MPRLLSFPPSRIKDSGPELGTHLSSMPPCGGKKHMWLMGAKGKVWFISPTLLLLAAGWGGQVHSSSRRQSEEGSRRAGLEASASAVVVRALYDFLYPLVTCIFRVPVCAGFVSCATAVVMCHSCWSQSKLILCVDIKWFKKIWNNEIFLNCSV